MSETYEEAEDNYLQAVGTAAYDAGVEAGEWLTWGWAKATGTAADVYGSAAQWVDDAVYTPWEFAEDTRNTLEKGVDKVADTTKDVVNKTAEIVQGATDDAMDIAKTIPYLVAAVGGLGLYLYFSKGKGRRR